MSLRMDLDENELHKVETVDIHYIVDEMYNKLCFVIPTSAMNVLA